MTVIKCAYDSRVFACKINVMNDIINYEEISCVELFYIEFVSVAFMNYRVMIGHFIHFITPIEHRTFHNRYMSSHYSSSQGYFITGTFITNK